MTSYDYTGPDNLATSTDDSIPPDGYEKVETPPCKEREVSTKPPDAPDSLITKLVYISTKSNDTSVKIEVDLEKMARRIFKNKIEKKLAE